MSDRSTAYASWFAVAVAALALVSSQIGPIPLWFKSDRIDLEVLSVAQVTDKIGYSNMALIVSTRNTGGRDVRLKKIEMSVSRGGKPVADLGVLRYVDETGQAPRTFLLTPLSLKPGEEWARLAIFSLPPLDRQADAWYRTARSALRDDIQSKEKTRKDPKAEIEADPKLIAPFLARFEENFKWIPGEYLVRIHVTTEPISASAEKSYRFVLYESDTADLRKRTLRYKFGEGVLTDFGPETNLHVPLIAVVSPADQ